MKHIKTLNTRDFKKSMKKGGFVSVSLGKSRLRTETAALVAVHLMHLHCD